MILPFSSIVMALITRAMVKIPSGLPVMERDYPIVARTMTQRKAHILGPSVGVSQIPRENVVEEGGDAEEEIEHFTSALKDTAQPFSQAHPRALDHPNHLIARVEQMYGMLESHMQHSLTQFTYLEGQITALSSQIDDMMRD